MRSRSLPLIYPPPRRRFKRFAFHAILFFMVIKIYFITKNPRKVRKESRIRTPINDLQNAILYGVDSRISIMSLCAIV